jgi:hypothetical protein
LFTVFENILYLNSDDQKIITVNKADVLKFIDFSVLKVSDEFVQNIILSVLLMYLLSILHATVAQKLLKLLICKFKPNLKVSKIIGDILATEKGILLCYYFELYEYLREEDNFAKPKTSLVTLIKERVRDNIKRKYYINKLDMGVLVLNINALRRNEKDLEKLYCDYLTAGKRKHLITTVLFNFLEKELKILKNVVNISQQVYDYIILNSLEEKFNLNTMKNYKIFLEIRSIFLLSFEKNITQVEYYPNAERQFNDYKFKQIGTDFKFYKKHTINNTLISQNSKLAGNNNENYFKIDELSYFSKKKPIFNYSLSMTRHTGGFPFARRTQSIDSTIKREDTLSDSYMPTVSSFKLKPEEKSNNKSVNFKKGNLFNLNYKTQSFKAESLDNSCAEIFKRDKPGERKSSKFSSMKDIGITTNHIDLNKVVMKDCKATTTGFKRTVIGINVITCLI